MPEPANDLMQTRLSLLDRLKQMDDRESWQEFVNIYGRLLYSFASRSGLTPEETDEAAGNPDFRCQDHAGIQV